MVTIKEVKTNKELKEFIKVPFLLYGDSDRWTPDLMTDELTNLRKDKNPAFDYCDARYFIAYKDGKTVGRVAAILSHRSNERWNQKRLRFSRIEFTNDDEVVDALFRTVTDWAHELGCDELHGPLGFTDLDKEGMLIEGFDEPDLFITMYHKPYYKEQMERMGFVKDVDWIEYRVFVPDVIPDKLARLSDVVARRTKVRFFHYNSKSELKPRIAEVFRLINDAYHDLYGVVALSETEIDHYVNQYIPFLQKDFLLILLDKDDKVCAFGLLMPSLSGAVKKAKGRIMPFGWVHILKALKTYDVLEMYLVAVRPDMQNTGLNAILLTELLKNAQKHGVKYAETGPELETNEKILAFWKHFDTKQHRRRRCWVKRV